MVTKAGLDSKTTVDRSVVGERSSGSERADDAIRKSLEISSGVDGNRQKEASDAVAANVRSATPQLPRPELEKPKGDGWTTLRTGVQVTRDPYESTYHANGVPSPVTREAVTLQTKGDGYRLQATYQGGETGVLLFGSVSLPTRTVTSYLEKYDANTWIDKGAGEAAKGAIYVLTFESGAPRLSRYTDPRPEWLVNTVSDATLADAVRATPALGTFAGEGGVSWGIHVHQSRVYSVGTGPGPKSQVLGWAREEIGLSDPR
jgi:hypothetical protein